jgi:hypothetical protein
MTKLVQLHIPAGTRLPDFVIIGAQRSGSVILQQLLHQHPQVYMPPAPKELHFFNRSVDRFDQYTAVFSTAEALGKQIGERSSNYFDMPEQRIEYMRRVLPNAKLIVVLRDPIARAWSHALMEVSNYQRKRLTKRDTKSALLHIGSIRNTTRTEYADLLNNWLTYYPKEQLLIVFKEECRTNLPSVWKQLCTFLEVDECPLEDFDVQSFGSHRLSMPRTAVWFLQRRYKQLPAQLNALAIPIPESWTRRKVKLATWRKWQTWLWIVPRNWFFNWTYTLYKKRKEDRMPVPDVYFESEKREIQH